MRRFGFHKASSLQEALELKAHFGTGGLLVAGGTDLLVALRDQDPSLPPVDVIDIGRLAELKGVFRQNGGIRLGPLATHTEVARSPEIRRWAPLLAAASAEVGSPQIRNRGTVGGNLCNASPCADTVPPLVALGAEATLRSVRGSRTVRVEEAVVAPYRTVLADDEILTDIHFAPIADGVGSAFVKLGRRNALSVSRMSVAVILGTGIVRIAAGSVLPTVRRFPEVEGFLDGKAPAAELFDAAGSLLAAEMIRISGRRWSTPYKEPVVAVLLKRALARAAGWV